MWLCHTFCCFLASILHDVRGYLFLPYTIINLLNLYEKIFGHVDLCGFRIFLLNKRMRA
jgi:hypothetical protein